MAQAKSRLKDSVGIGEDKSLFFPTGDMQSWRLTEVFSSAISAEAINFRPRIRSLSAFKDTFTGLSASSPSSVLLQFSLRSPSALRFVSGTFRLGIFSSK
jgi:hypothetical protein